MFTKGKDITGLSQAETQTLGDFTPVAANNKEYGKGQQLQSDETNSEVNAAAQASYKKTNEDPTTSSFSCKVSRRHIQK